MQFNAGDGRAIKLTKRVSCGKNGSDYLFEEVETNKNEKDYFVVEYGYQDSYYKVIGFTKTFISCVRWNMKENKVCVYESSLDNGTLGKKYVVVHKFKIGGGRVHRVS